MSNVTFIQFKNAVARQVSLMTQQPIVLRTQATKEELQTTYLESFPDGTNPIYRERRIYDGNYDLTFISQFGGAVTFINGKKVSVWDIEVGGYYQPVINALRTLVHNSEIHAPFFHHNPYVGVVDHNFELLSDNTTKRWEHFYAPLPETLVVPEDKIPSKISKLRSTYDVFKRSMETLSLASGEIVMELIKSDNLYRGEENKYKIDFFIELKKEFESYGDVEADLQNFFWSYVLTYGRECSIRNTSIGTLLVDISEGLDLEDSVAKFEDKVSEGNYKRTSSVATSGMIDKAKKSIVSLGLEEALYRRYARLNDLTINNVLFANRDARKVMCPFEKLKEKSPVVTGKGGYSLNNPEEIKVDDFMKIIVPRVTNIEVLVENRHINNLVSLIAPENLDAGNMLKWDNNFSWSYRGEVTDSIREKVKKAGGNVEGVLRCSLSWNNIDDLDIHVKQPSGEIINFSNKRSYRTDGCLDIDMNAYGKFTEGAVENVFWEKNPPEGNYVVTIHNYTKRCTDQSKDGFEVEIEGGGSSTVFGVGNNPHDGQYLRVVEFNYSKKDGVKFVKNKYNGVSNNHSENVWGIITGSFQKVNMIMNSPNHWDGNCTGNKHLFFSLANCRSDVEARGFYNEFLREELYPHRKSFEMLGGMLKAPVTDEQVSGLGFSSTKRNDAIFKVDGRIFKVLF